MESATRFLEGPEGRHRAKVATAAALLLLLAGGSAVAWRFEIELRDRDWIGYFHSVFALSEAAFVVWALAVARFVHGLSALRLSLLGAFLVAVGAVGLILIPWMLIMAFGGWSGGLLSIELARDPTLVKELPRLLSRPGNPGLEYLLKDLAFWGAWVSPTVAIWIALRAAGIRSRLWSVPLSGLVQFWAWPVSSWALAIFQDRGGSDPADVVRSGFLIPFLVVAIGLPFLAAPAPLSRSA